MPSTKQSPPAPFIARAKRDRDAGEYTIRRVFVENGLSIVVIGVFIGCWAAQAISGWRVYNLEQQEDGRPRLAFREYLGTGDFWEVTGENWESEFLQMGMFVWLTAWLFQVGSPESKNPYQSEVSRPVTRRSPWPVRRGGWVKLVYSRSLSLAFLSLFLVSMGIHVLGGRIAYNHKQAAHAQPSVSIPGYLGTSQFWFESTQNWQSEFLAIGAMVLLSIFLRHRGSAESKELETPHGDNEP